MNTGSSLQALRNVVEENSPDLREELGKISDEKLMLLVRNSLQWDTSAAPKKVKQMQIRFNRIIGY